MPRPSGRENIDYWYCGSPTLKPVAASDDGVHTRLRFAANAELPGIFVRNADASESLLNFSMESGDVVVHRVARQLHSSPRQARRMRRQSRASRVGDCSWIQDRHACRATHRAGSRAVNAGTWVPRKWPANVRRRSSPARSPCNRD